MYPIQAPANPVPHGSGKFLIFWHGSGHSYSLDSELWFPLPTVGGFKKSEVGFALNQDETDFTAAGRNTFDLSSYGYCDLDKLFITNGVANGVANRYYRYGYTDSNGTYYSDMPAVAPNAPITDSDEWQGIISFNGSHDGHIHQEKTAFNSTTFLVSASIIAQPPQINPSIELFIVNGNANDEVEYSLHGYYSSPDFNQIIVEADQLMTSSDDDLSNQSDVFNDGMMGIVPILSGDINRHYLWMKYRRHFDTLWSTLFGKDKK